MPIKIGKVGLKGFIRNKVSKISNISYLTIAKARKVSKDPSSNEITVSFLINSKSLKYYNI